LRTVQDLRNLAGTGRETADETIKQIFLWRHERSMTLARGLAGFGATVLSAALVAGLTASGQPPLWPLVVAILGGLTSASLGLRTLVRLRNVEAQFFVTVVTLASLLPPE
jgi:uncharacterized membrane protein YfcA